MKRHFLQLAHPLNLRKHSIAGALMSEKLDGSRCFWDGGISRGLFIDQVPYANLNKKGHLTARPVATGLWSRYGNVIRAPECFLASLPPMLLDGELTAGRGTFQYSRSVTADHSPGPGWKDIKFMVLDSPRPECVFADGTINETNFKRELKGCLEWAQQRSAEVMSAVPYSRYASFQTLYAWLKNNIAPTGNLEVLEQQQLPFSTPDAVVRLESYMSAVVDGGGEGVVVRKANSIWAPERTHDVMKHKPYSDAEGTVTGYVWGRETALGSKLLGLMGALVLDFRGKRLELSGFTDAERVMHSVSTDDYTSREPYRHPGEEVTSKWLSQQFPRGSVVSFKYRELSDAGLPKEARFFRKRAEHAGVMQ